MPNSSPFVASVNELLAKLEDNPTVDTGIELANQIVSLFGDVHTKSVEDVFESSIELPNAERYDSWFQPHPIFKSDRACFDLADSPLLQAKFYWLKKRSRQIIAGGVHFTPNYEDEEFTHNERYKVGLDFFLSPNGKSLQVVLSNRGNLRIVELAGRLNNTQKEIFEKWLGAGSLNTQEALHTTLWESFKLKSVNQKFYDGVSNSFTELLQHLKSIAKDEEEAKLFASRLLGRLLFCWFLRKKGIIDESVGYFNAQGADATAYYKQSLERLFFLTLNTPIDERDELTKQHQKALFPELLVDDQPSLFKTDQKTPYLNGGLFEPHENDWYKDDSLTLPEGFFTNLYEHFEEFNFTTDESSPEYEQIAIDPEMLGRVFESLLATQIDETGQQARKAKGAFYTPREIVSYMCKESLRNYLYNAVNNDEATKESIDSLLDITDSEWAKSKSNTLRDKVKNNRTQIIDALDVVTILDPACGSGAFPMGMLQLMLKTYERLESRFDPYKTKLSVIQNNIFGVDIEPMAVEISRLRAWLSLIVDEDDPRSVDPLPNLDFKFVCANSLVPLDKEMGLFSDSSLHQKLKDIRTKYFNARKKHTKKALQDEYYKLTSSEQTSLITDDKRTKQLKSFDPFKNSIPAQFYDNDHMFGMEIGFDIVIGNPPYNAKFTDSEKAYFKQNYESVARGRQDSAAIFVELAYRIGGAQSINAYIIPYRLYSRARNHGAFQAYNLKSFSIKQILYLGSNIGFSANDEFMVVLQSKPYDENNDVRVALKPNLNTTLVFKTIKQKTFNESSEVNLNLVKYDQELISKIDNCSQKLGNICEVKDGIVPYIREKMVSTTKIDERYVPFAGVAGKYKLDRYKFERGLLWICYDINEAKKFISDKVELRKVQLRDRTIFERRKIVSSQNSSILKAAIDEGQTFVSNSIHSIFLKNETIPGITLEYLLGCFNSSLMNYYHNTLRKKATDLHPQILLGDIKKLPVVAPNESNLHIINDIHDLVSKIVAKGGDDTVLVKKIDDLVYQLFKLSDDEIKVIEEAVN